MRRSPFRIAAAVLLAALLATNVYRAVTQSIVHDEAFSWELYLSGPASAIFTTWDPNNHFLATLLFRISTSLFGFSGLAMRLPSLLAGALYFGAVFRLCLLLFGEGWVFLLGTALLSLNPMVLDFLVAARGYGLGIATLFWALCEMTAYLQAGGNRNRRHLWRAAAGLSMAVAANLAYLFPATILAIAFSVQVLRTRPATPALPAKQHKKQKTPTPAPSSRLAHFVVPIIGLALLYLLSAPVDLIRTQRFVGAASALESARNLVQFSFTSGEVGAKLCTDLIVWFLTAGSLAALCGAILFRASAAWTLLAPVTVVGTALLHALGHLALGLPYPTDRAGIHFVPLAALSYIVLAWSLLERSGYLRWIGRASLAICLVFIAVFISEWHTSYFEYWRYDADTNRLFEKIEKIRGSQTNVRLGASWQLEPALNFYRARRHADWMLPVERDGFTGDRQYYAFITNDHAQIGLRRLAVIYRGAVSGTVLATAH